MKKIDKKIVLIGVVLALSLPWTGCKKSTVVKTTTSQPSGPVELKLKWPEGRQMVQSFELKMDNEMNVPGAPAAVKQDMTMDQKYGMTVLKDRPDGKHEVEFEFLSSRMLMKMGDKVMFDTDSTEKKPGNVANSMNGVFKKLIGAKIHFLLDASNRVEKVEGIQDLQSRLSSGKANDPTGAMNSMFKEDYFKQMMDHGRNLPPKAVSPGDTWPVQLEIDMGELGVMDMNYTYTLENWEQRNDRYCARIGIDGTLKVKPGENPQTKGMNLAIEGGKSTGETWFDLDLGMFVDTTINQDMKLTITVPNQGRNKANAPKTQTITGTIDQVITMKLDSVK